MALRMVQEGSSVGRSRGILPPQGIYIERPRPLRVALLGATGSIGRQTVDVVRKHADHIELVALAAHRSAEEVAALTHEFPTVRHIALADTACRTVGALDDVPPECSVSFGQEAVDELASLDDVDCVLNALVGFAGMRASYTALSSEHELALANKESLVVAGDLIMPLAHPGMLLPVDSEHAAIFQCFVGEDPWTAERIWLTASGSPFWGASRDQLTCVTPQQALDHPNWKMGAKVTIDSSTLMNKGLEVIEAHHLFDFPFSHITIVIQRQSIIHSMVEYTDGSIMAQAASPDMRIPIQYALSYPERWEAPCAPLNVAQLDHLDMGEPDLDVFDCLRLALDAGERGGTAPCVLNAADEVAIGAFLAEEIGYLDIGAVVQGTLSQFRSEPVESLDQLETIDAEARIYARELVAACTRR